MVAPRPGTISPWSSKATDIAHICGLAGVKRIERVIAYTFDFGAEAGGLRISNLPSYGTVTNLSVFAAKIAPLIHDRMTQVVFGDL